MPKAFQLKIDLLDTDPPIWRRILVGPDATWWALHVAIQDAMGWLDCHLHQFTVEGADKEKVVIGIPDPDYPTSTLPGWKRRLTKDLRKPGDQAHYEYDFGDSWEHRVVLEERVEVTPFLRFPRCLDGARCCPPEDCGGTWGYRDLLEALADPVTEEQQELVEWLAEEVGEYDPEAFDPEQIRFDDPQARLKRVGLE